MPSARERRAPEYQKTDADVAAQETAEAKRDRRRARNAKKVGK